MQTRTFVNFWLRDISVSDQPELTAAGTAAITSGFVGHSIQIAPRHGLIKIKPQEQAARFIERFGAARLAVQEFGA